MVIILKGEDESLTYGLKRKSRELTFIPPPLARQWKEDEVSSLDDPAVATPRRPGAHPLLVSHMCVLR